MKSGIAVAILFWLGMVSLSCWWNLHEEGRGRQELALATARAFFRQLVITRAWNAGHGGVYVVVRGDMQPNPYLEDPLRDLRTDKGLTLTKVNPAYMTRQIAEIAALDNGITFHITSRRPLRPENGPLPWEEEWLRSFEEGVQEQGEFVQAESQALFRYMAPLRVEQSCLPCHGRQGYRLGDIRGGISVVLPFLAPADTSVLLAAHAFLGGAGALLILAGGVLLLRKQGELRQSNDSLRQTLGDKEQLIADLKEANSRIKTLCGIVPICMYCKGIRDDKGYWNQLEKFISEHSAAQFSHGICPRCLHERHPQLAKEKGGESSSPARSPGD